MGGAEGGAVGGAVGGSAGGEVDIGGKGCSTTAGAGDTTGVSSASPNKYS